MVVELSSLPRRWLDLAPGMRIDFLQHAEGLEKEWWDLWRRDPQATPFQSPAWLLPWRRNFDEGENVVLVLRRQGRLVGLLPLFRLDGRLLLWGAGTSDWLGGLFDPALDESLLRTALEELEEPLDLFQLAAASPLWNILVPDGWTERCGFSESCAVLPLPARPSAKMKQKVRYYRRRAARAGVGEPEEVGSDYVASLVDLHTRRWNEREEAGIFADERFCAWQESAAEQMQRAGLLRLYAMRLAGRTIAALYVMAAKGRAFYYIGGFDPEYGTLGLGTILVGHAIAEAERNAFRAFDFLRGREAYKYRWGAIDQATHARYLMPPTAA